jgi:hypothetical protein
VNQTVQAETMSRISLLPQATIAPYGYEGKGEGKLPRKTTRFSPSIFSVKYKTWHSNLKITLDKIENL